MSIYLRHFTPDELLFDQQECFAILQFFFVHPGIQAAELTVEDRSFAQALLVEAIDASYKMGYAEVIFRTFFGKSPTSWRSVALLAARFVKGNVQHWFKYAKKDDLRDPKIYESVRATIAQRAHSVWRIRLQTGELTY